MDATGKDTVSFADLAAELGTSTERIAQFAGALVPDDPRTGRVLRPWTGKGADYRLTRNQADELAAEWARSVRTTEGFTNLIDGTEPIEQMPNRWRA